MLDIVMQDQSMITTEQKNNLIALTAEIVSAHVSHNSVAVSDLSTLIANVHTSLAGLGIVAEPVAAEQQSPAVSIRTSIKPDYIVCLEDGKRMKTLKRHLMTEHQMTPADYRAKWHLPADYPIVASAYASERRTLALSFGLGKTKRAGADADVEQPVAAEPVELPAVPEAAAISAPKVRSSRLKTSVGNG